MLILEMCQEVSKLSVCVGLGTCHLQPKHYLQPFAKITLQPKVKNLCQLCSYFACDYLCPLLEVYLDKNVPVWSVSRVICTTFLLVVCEYHICTI